MSPELTAACILGAVILTLVVSKVLHGRKKPAIVAQAESVIAADGWKMLASTVAAVADASSKKNAVANATADLAEHFQNVAKLKAAVAALPDA